MAHFEIHVSDLARARKFYAGLFGWNFDLMSGENEPEYYLISGPGIVGHGAGLSGGMMERMDDMPKSGSPIRGCTMTFEVADCDEHYDWALKNGGGEALPPMDYPGIGRAACVEDGEGNVVGFITPEAGKNT